jgi:hypothetical protein
MSGDGSVAVVGGDVKSAAKRVSPPTKTARFAEKGLNRI